MYVGGQRVELRPPPRGQPPWSYFNQPDWIEPDPVTIANASYSAPASEFVYLHLFEQEVSAVEDPDLKDVALGGPDTTQRVRLVRRIKRIPVESTTCASAFSEAQADWAAKGLWFDPRTMRLLPRVSLQVGFAASTTPASPCDPSAEGGYLGADNQLIRLQIAEVNGQGQLLWGYDNASVLYAVIVQADNQTLQLSQPPVDAFHFPTPGQVVEVLRSAVILGSEPNETPAQGPIIRCVAEAIGVVGTVKTYVNSTNILTLTSALPTAYSQDKNPIFLRVWQGQMPINPAASQTILVQDPTNQTGIQVTLTLPTSGATVGPLPIGAYWMIAVRPDTPQAVYPERYLTAPQPPDGPRQWVCPLAVIDWVNSGSYSASVPAVINNCCQPFDNLVTLTNRHFGNELNVTGVVANGCYGYGMVVQNGQTLTGCELAQGLLIFLDRDIVPSSATTAACSVTLELPFFINGTIPGYQPQILASSVGTSNPGVITWNPTPDAYQYLMNELPLQILATLPFSIRWDTVPSAPPGIWSYISGGVESNLAANLAPSTNGFTAASKLPVQANVGTLRMSVFPPNTPNRVYPIGLIFNYVSANDYWEFALFEGSVTFEDDGYSILMASITHYSSGSSTQAQTTIGTPSDIPTITSVDFTITQSSTFSATLGYSMEGSSAYQSRTISLPSPSPSLEPNTRVGLFNNWPGTSTFTRLALNFGSGGSQDFLQPPPLPILGRLQVRRDFLQPALAGAGPSWPGNQSRSPLPDFSMWFWFQSFTSVYGLGSGGIGFLGVGLWQI